ncbi:MAG: multicopper oxidase family protein [Gemmataceae bacterium]
MPASAEDEAARTREFEGAFPAERAPSGPVREFAVTAAPAVVPLFDGRPVQVWAYNGQVPGPTLRIRLGETLRVAFTNRLPQPSTIHWHGVRVPNRMDGVPGVTQPPVPPGGTFVYEFTPKDAGTFWFHPHVRASEQVERGLFGVLVVEDPSPPPYSRDVVWVLDDWLVTGRSEIDPSFNTTHDLAHDGRWGNVITVNGDHEASLDVRPGERIRLRLINVANGRAFLPDFAGLDARAIAVDGMYAARPLDPSRLELAPGNRLDVDLTIPPDRVGQRLAVLDRFTQRPLRLAELVVRGEVVPTPDFASPAAAKVPEWAGGEGAPARLELRLNARRGGPYGIQWTLNDVAMDHDHGQGSAGAPPYRLPLGAWSKVRFTNESYRLHPMHMHGMFFKLLARNGRRVDEPHWRDTVLVGPKETVDVGLVPQDAGRWMVHCHILEHAESGMMTLVEVR